MNIDNTDLNQIRRLGIEILNRELGPVAMIRFFQQYEKGYGDYSTERHEWIGKISIKEIAANAKALRENKSDAQDK